MNTQHSRPVITPAMREQAARQPNTWLYVVDPIFTDPSAEIPPWGFIGGYRVDARGELTDDFSPNPNYRPSPVALRLPAPNNDLERALQLTTTGYAQGQALLSALLEAEVVLFAQPQGNGLFTMEHESGRRQLQVFTSDAYLPPNWTTWQRMTGWQLANHQPNGLDIQVNPTSPVKARIPGEDLVRAAGMALRASESRNTLSPAAEVSTSDTSTFVPVPQQALATTPAPPAPPESQQQAKQAQATSEAQLQAGETKTADSRADQPKVVPSTATQSTAAQSEATQSEATQSTAARSTAAQSKAAQSKATRSKAADSARSEAPTDTDLGQRFLGAVLAGAAGDALGSVVEFYPLDQIRSRYGERGVVDYDRSSDRPGAFTDDTQMTLFTLEGLVRGHISVRTGTTEGPLPAVQLAYQRWLHTQGYAWTRAAGPFAEEHPEPTGWLVGERDLFSVRAPSSSCITALRGFATGGQPAGFATDGAQDASGLARCAPVALWSDSPREVFELAAATAALTCPHPNGYLPAGVQAVLVQRLIRGEPLRDALRRSRELLAGYAGHEATDTLLVTASDLAREGVPSGERLKEALGGGWNAHEALAIALCAALSTESISSAVTTAVNHSGDSDTTGAVCGTIVGARYGSTAVPAVWLRDLQLRETLETAVRDALTEFGGAPSDDAEFLERYPAEHDRSALEFATTPPAVGDQQASSGEQEQQPETEQQESAEDSEEAGFPEQETGGADSPSSESTSEGAQESTSTGAVVAATAVAAGAAATAAAASASESESPAEPRTADSGTTGSGAADSGAAEPDPAESGPVESGPVESGPVESGPVESGPVESGTETAPATEPATPTGPAARGGLTDDRTTRITGCLLGGALGDALGQPIADESLEAIREVHGEQGVRDLVDGRYQAGSLGDATQMSLFTLEGLVRAGRARRLRGDAELSRHVQRAYQRWLHTQGVEWSEAGGADGGEAPDGWLVRQPGLFARRSPGDTCLRALRGHASGEPAGSFHHRINESKGSGGVVRAAPAGLWSDDPTEVFRAGATTAVLTHGHPSGFLPAGALAVIVQQLVVGESLPNAVDRALTEMSAWGGHEETLIGLRGAIELAATGDPTPERITEQLGTGEVGEQALAIAVCAALAHPQSYIDAVLLAANHSGASHSTAAVCGAIMGAAQGASAVPVRWRDKLELRETIEALARDAAVELGRSIEQSGAPVEDDELARRYPLPAPANTGGGGQTTEATYDTAGTEPAEIASAREHPPERTSEEPEEQSTSGSPANGEPAVEEHAVEEPTSREPATHKLVYRGAVTDQPTAADQATTAAAQPAPASAPAATAASFPDVSFPEVSQDSEASQPLGTRATGPLETGSLEPLGAGPPDPEQHATQASTGTAAGTERMPRPAPQSQQAQSQQAQSESAPEEPAWESLQAPATGTPQPFPAAPTTEEPGTPATTAESAVEPGAESFEETDEPDDLLSDEELRLLAAWRKFRDGENDTPTDLSEGLRKLLAEAFGEERAAQLVGEAQPDQAGELAAESTEQLGREQRLAGCVLGAAVGDALAAPWVFADLATIMHNNPGGVREYSEFFGRRGAVTALGQQSVFLLDGLLRAVIRARHEGVGGQVPSMVRLALQHWVCTQGARFDPALPVGLLTGSSTLRAQRFPDETSLVALSHDPQGPAPTPSEPPNGASSVAATVRGAAVGFHADNPQTALSLGAEVGVLTHGHPDGYLPAGALAAMIASIQDGQTISESVQSALSHLEVFEGGDTTADKLRSAVEFAAQGPVPAALLEELGAGWQGPEALAIAVAAALSHPNELTEAVSLAATHSGNSAATAAICGALLGAARGADALPQEWVDELETRELLEQMLADDARVDAEIRAGEPVPDWANRYLG